MMTDEERRAVYDLEEVVFATGRPPDVNAYLERMKKAALGYTRGAVLALPCWKRAAVAWLGADNEERAAFARVYAGLRPRGEGP